MAGNSSIFGVIGRLSRILTATALSIWACLGQAQATSAPDLPLVQMSHKTWTARDGAPQTIQSLAEAPDGTLWIGSEGGLYNFDGRTFKAFTSPPGEPELPSGAVTAIRIARDGAVWIGTTQGMARVALGHVTRYLTVDALPLATIFWLDEAADGSMWASGRKSLVRIGTDRTAHLEETPLSLSTNIINGFFIDSSNTQWLGQGGRLHRRPPGRPNFEPTDVEVEFIFGWAETADGSLWIADFTRSNGGIGRKRRVDRDGKLVETLADDLTPSSILVLPDGSLIVGTQSVGLNRYVADGSVDRITTGSAKRRESFTRAEGLSSNETAALLRDTDGNLWVGGRRGLDRFRRARLIPFQVDDTSDKWSVCTNPQGEVWIASLAHLYKVAGGTVRSFPGGGDSYQLHCGSDGDTWSVTGLGLLRVHEDQITPVSAVPGVGPYGYSHVISAPGDTLIAAAAPTASATGIWERRDGQWARVVRPGLPAISARVLYVDLQGQWWVGYADGQVALLLAQESRVFSPGNRGLENVWALLQTSLGMFAAGGNGLAVQRDQRFELLSFADPAFARGIGALVESRNGDLWLNAAQGVVHVRAGELRAAIADPAYPMKSELVTEGEFIGPAQLLRRASAARDADGNLWFAGPSGVFHLDPEDQPKSRAPILSLRSLKVDGRAIGDRGTVGPNPQALEVQYLGVNLTAPERVTYKYRLEGFEDTWQEAGHRTEAIYKQLRPGTYTFHVIASNDDGVWTNPVSSSPVTVLPSFYQTMWFAALCVIAGVLGLAGVFALRVRAITRAVRARAEERADERIRIARELHDTLLQGVQGLLLQFHVAAQKIAPDAESKLMLERALATADRIIIEGRNRVGSLRSDHLTDGDLVWAIDNVGRELSPDDTVRFGVTRSGTSAVLHAHVADEVFYIAREALTNAFRHAEANAIKVELCYGERFFMLSCEDDGRGFEPADRDKAGHWGLKGMAERAARLGGTLQFSSRSLQGTRIGVSIPSYRAYRQHSRLMFYLRAIHWPARRRHQGSATRRIQ